MKEVYKSWLSIDWIFFLGLSDPYCMLCVIQDGQGDKVSDNGNKIKKRLLRQFVEEKDVKLTKIMMKTLNPEWNQQFKLWVSFFLKSFDCQNFHRFWTKFIREQIVTQRSMGHEAPKYPPQYPGP